MKRSVKWLWIIVIGGILAVNLVAVLINAGAFGYMPSMEELENPSSALASEVYGADGSVMGRYFIEDRSYTDYKDISPNVVHALIATEDERFYEHSGIDAIGTMAIPYYLVTGKRRGSSTLTQQLAKNLFPRENANMFTIPFIKLKEWILAIKLERNLTKDEIVALYLNTVPFSDNTYGIKNASKTFFNKKPGDLKVEEAAVLVGMLKGNTLYNPRRNPKTSTDRRNVVMDQMVKNNFLSPGEAQNLKGQPIKLDYNKIASHHEGVAPYFRQVLEQDLKKWCKEHKKPDGHEYNIYKDGLKIYTSIDPTMQRYAEQAVAQHLASLQKQFVSQSQIANGSIWKKHAGILNDAVKNSDRYRMMKDEGTSEADILKVMNTPVKMKVFAWNNDRMKDTTMTPVDSIKYMRQFLQCGFVVMDPSTGYVKAWVGGINHNYFQYDHCNYNTKRQVGSTIKPLLYCLAVDNGTSPCATISAAPVYFPSIKKTYDAGGASKGAMSMRNGLAHSINNIALNIINITGVKPFIDFAHKCGITSNLEPYPSIALGAGDISLLEMVRAYSMFPNAGINTKPMYITKIEDRNGNLLASFVPEQKEIISDATAYAMVRMMQGVVDFGTGQRMRSRYGIQSEMGGKTGTTNNQADAWFMGYTPQLVAGVWVGCDDRFLRFSSTALGQGSAAALPVYAYFFQKVYADKTLGIDKNAKFVRPASLANRSDCDLYNDEYSGGGFNAGQNGADSTPDEEIEEIGVPDESEYQ
jgi:penicillin-binding protein 1A